MTKEQKLESGWDSRPSWVLMWVQVWLLWVTGADLVSLTGIFNPVRKTGTSSANRRDNIWINKTEVIHFLLQHTHQTHTHTHIYIIGTAHSQLVVDALKLTCTQSTHLWGRSYRSVSLCGRLFCLLWRVISDLVVCSDVLPTSDNIYCRHAAARWLIRCCCVLPRLGGC